MVEVQLRQKNNNLEFEIMTSAAADCFAATGQASAALLLLEGSNGGAQDDYNAVSYTHLTLPTKA